MSAPLTFERTMPPALRAFLAAAGMLCVILPTWELRQALLQPGWWTLFFGVIILGAWSVGGAFLAAAVFGERQSWRFQSGTLIIERRSLIRTQHEHIRAAQVKQIEVCAIEWDSRPETYCVQLTTSAGLSFGTPDTPRREDAEALANRIRVELRVL